MSKNNNHNCGIYPVGTKPAKPPQKPEVEVVLKYRIYSIDEKGMLNEPKHYWGDTKYDSGYGSMEEALVAIVKAGDYSEYTILPITFTRLK